MSSGVFMISLRICGRIYQGIDFSNAELDSKGINMNDQTKAKAVEILNKILEMELAGTIHYTHYSFMVFGYNRIPIVSWMEQQATESMAHARAAGELVTQLGAHPSLAIGPLLETHRHDIGDILRESLDTRRRRLSNTRTCWNLFRARTSCSRNSRVNIFTSNDSTSAQWIRCSAGRATSKA